MRFGSGVDTEHNSISTLNIYEINNQIKYLKGLFESVLLINPMSNTLVEITENTINDSNMTCSSKCPLHKDTCGCICKDIVSSQEKRSRFTYDKTLAYFVIGKPVKTKYRTYILLLIMKLDPTFTFGAHEANDAISSITKLTSSLVIDPLTQIFNRKYLMDNINYMMKKADTQHTELCLACIDVDNFKRFNDTYGHDFGDIVLKKIAELMKESISVIEEAYPIRIGGDEFVIVSVGIDKNRFRAIMSKLCMMVDGTKLLYGREKVGIRISIGVAGMLADRQSTYKGIYDIADANLYKAKEAGKGCVR